ncbi:MAG: hypothetical protein NT007_18830 [Candidatus Kapabacteria bacterium]|nr:hypothetical protein [Candidatus Kapabacteria bacterium]
MRLILLISFFSGLNHFKLAAQDNDLCLGCHDDASITKEKNGKVISLTVKKFVFARSVHKKLNCISCHVGFDPNNIPHKANIETPNCMNCHYDAPSRHKFHPQMARATGQGGAPNVDCKGCHGHHDITSPKDPNSKFHFTKLLDFCGNCHKDKKEQHLQSEHFFAYSNNNPNVPTCIYCHKQPVTKASLLAPAELKANQVKLCLSCHLHNPAVTSPYSKSLVNYEQSVHGQALAKGKKEAAVCIDCHGVHKLQKADNPDSRINQAKVPELCGKCHIEVSREYRMSVHGIALKKGEKDAPGCTFCHGEHGIKAQPEIPHKMYEESLMKRATLIRTKMFYCVVCHADEAMMKKYKLNTIEKAHDWLPNKEAHWETVRCVDCHSSYAPPNLSHNILPPEKTIKKCEGCHQQNSKLMAKLYKHQKKQSREKYGFVNGTLLSDAYVIGSTRNIFLDVMSVLLTVFTFIGVFIHGTMRWVTNRRRRSL